MILFAFHKWGHQDGYVFLSLKHSYIVWYWYKLINHTIVSEAWLALWLLRLGGQHAFSVMVAQGLYLIRVKGRKKQQQQNRKRLIQGYS